MKIYPGRHQVEQVKTVDNNRDIPLAFIDANYRDYVVNVLPRMSSNKMEPVIPYEELHSLDVCLFDSNRNEIDNTSILQRDRDKYYYVPQKAMAFTPQRFNYSVVGKKRMSYKMNMQYDIKVGCVDNDTMDFSKLMIKVFGDAPIRKICPNNVFVNSGDVSVESLVNSSIADNDFVFIKAKDEKTYKEINQEIDLNLFLNEHTNVWLSVDSFSNNELVYNLPESSQEVILKKPIVYNCPALKTNLFKLSSLKNEQGVIYHNIFTGEHTAAIIKEYPNKGFVIMTPSSFIDHIENNVKLFYEIMMYVYLNSYCESNKINEWITDIVPDYVAINNKLIKKVNFSSNIEFNRLLNLSKNDVDLVDVKITPDNVKFAGISNNHILFRKDMSNENVQYTDPAKPSGSISIFTPRQNIVYYKDFIYKIEENVQEKITWELQNGRLIFNIKPFVDSLNGINIKQESSLQFLLFEITNNAIINVTEATLYLVCRDNILNLVPESIYTNTNGIIIAEIQINQLDNKSQVYDMRQRGGGCLESVTDPTQSLLDIGNISGMSYRKAGTVIITLPKRLEPFEDLITKVVQKHIVAEELPIILFEDKEE